VSLEYYYFMASLPMLEFGAKMPFSRDRFINLCREYLTLMDAEFIQRVNILPNENAEDSSRILREWKRFDIILRNEMARSRALKYGMDAQPYIRGDDYSDPVVFKFAKWILEQDSPLGMELALDRFRWQKIDELGKGHYFDIDCLTVYVLHLLILDKWNKINSVNGLQVLRQWIGGEMS
jgi:hypothetical protein